MQSCTALLAQHKVRAGLGIGARVGVADEVEGLQQRANPQELVQGRHGGAVQLSLHLRRVCGGHGHVRDARRIQAPRNARQVAAGCTQRISWTWRVRPVCQGRITACANRGSGHKASWLDRKVMRACPCEPQAETAVEDATWHRGAG